MIKYVSSQIFDWDLRAESWSIQKDSWKIPYSYLQHAEELINANNNKHYLIDAISNIKRAIDHRVKEVSQDYKFKKLSSLIDVKGNMEVLKELELIKPKMVHDVMTLRNILEHQFSDPPNQARCLELAEVAWYFLKSTDYISRQISDGANFVDIYDENYCFGLDGSPKNDWLKTVSGWLPHDMVSDEEKDGFFAVEVIELKSGADQKKKCLDSNEILYNYYNSFDDLDVYLECNIIDYSQLVKFVRGYFQAI